MKRQRSHPVEPVLCPSWMRTTSSLLWRMLDLKIRMRSTRGASSENVPAGESATPPGLFTGRGRSSSVQIRSPNPRRRLLLLFHHRNLVLSPRFRLFLCHHPRNPQRGLVQGRVFWTAIHSTAAVALIGLWTKARMTTCRAPGLRGRRGSLSRSPNHLASIFQRQSVVQEKLPVFVKRESSDTQMHRRHDGSVFFFRADGTKEERGHMT